MSTNQLTPEIKLILKENRNLELDKDTNKIKCSLSGHEMPCSIDQIKLYLNGKKFKKLKAKQDDVFEKYKPHIVPNFKKGNEHKLFCVLTRSTINRSVEHVERHINGATYKRALAQWEARKNSTTTTTTSDDGLDILDEGSSSEEEESDEDDMSDLYPDADDGDNDDFYQDDDDDDADLDQVEDIQEKSPKPSTSKRKLDSKDSQTSKKKQKKKPK